MHGHRSWFLYPGSRGTGDGSITQWAPWAGLAGQAGANLTGAGAVLGSVHEIQWEVIVQLTEDSTATLHSVLKRVGVAWGTFYWFSCWTAMQLIDGILINEEIS